MASKAADALVIPVELPRLCMVWAKTYQPPPDAPAFQEACSKTPRFVRAWVTPVRLLREGKKEKNDRMNRHKVDGARPQQPARNRNLITYRGCEAWRASLRRCGRRRSSAWLECRPKTAPPCFVQIAAPWGPSLPGGHRATLPPLGAHQHTRAPREHMARCGCWWASRSSQCRGYTG